MRLWVCCRAKTPIWKETLVISEIQVIWLHVCLQKCFSSRALLCIVVRMSRSSSNVHFLLQMRPTMRETRIQGLKSYKKFPNVNIWFTPKSIINVRPKGIRRDIIIIVNSTKEISSLAKISQKYLWIFAWGTQSLDMTVTWMCGIYSIPGFPDDKLKHLCVCRTNHWQPGREFTSWNKCSCYLDVNFRQSLEQ